MTEEPSQVVAAPSLLSALRAVQTALPALPKDKVNPHFGSRFTGLDTIVERVDPILREHGLLWTTFPSRAVDGQPVLLYQLIHVSSGEMISGELPLILSKADMQGLGSAITYARRYSISAVLNLVADEDDDANAASSAVTSASTNAPAGTVNLQREAKGLRNEAINAALAKAGLPADAKPWGVLGQIPADRADAVREALELQQTMA